MKARYEFLHMPSNSLIFLQACKSESMTRSAAEVANQSMISKVCQQAAKCIYLIGSVISNLP